MATPGTSTRPSFLPAEERPPTHAHATAESRAYVGAHAPPMQRYYVSTGPPAGRLNSAHTVAPAEPPATCRAQYERELAAHAHAPRGYYSPQSQPQRQPRPEDYARAAAVHQWRQRYAAHNQQRQQPVDSRVLGKRGAPDGNYGVSTPPASHPLPEDYQSPTASAAVPALLPRISCLLHRGESESRDGDRADAGTASTPVDGTCNRNRSRSRSSSSVGSDSGARKRSRTAPPPPKSQPPPQSQPQLQHRLPPIEDHGDQPRPVPVPTSTTPVSYPDVDAGYVRSSRPMANHSVLVDHTSVATAPQRRPQSQPQVKARQQPPNVSMAPPPQRRPQPQPQPQQPQPQQQQQPTQSQSRHFRATSSSGVSTAANLTYVPVSAAVSTARPTAVSVSRSDSAPPVPTAVNRKRLRIQHPHPQSADPALQHREVTERRRLYFNRIDPRNIHSLHIPNSIPLVTHYRTARSLPAGGRARPREPRGHTNGYMEPRQQSHSTYNYHSQELELEPPPEQSHRTRRRLGPQYAATVYEAEPQRGWKQERERDYGLEVLEETAPYLQGRSVPYEREYSHSTSQPRESRPSPNPAVSSAAVTNARESSSATSMLLQSKDFLRAQSLVRNRHDEIDWVATFLKVGFDSSSIYALMCPLRKGRWKAEEERYTLELLRLIENGTIRLRHGQSIRGFIGKRLHSDDMRVLKKLSNCKLFHFARHINPRLAEEERVDMSVPGATQALARLEKLKSDFLRSVQLEALVAVRKYLSDSSLRDLLNVRT